MKLKGITFLRLGLGITFLWIGILIFQHPDAWANFLQDYFTKLLPVSAVTLMKFTSFLDVGLGLLLILNQFSKLAAAIAVLHMIAILVSSGLTDVTVRDIGLLGASMALFLDTKGSIFKQ